MNVSLSYTTSEASVVVLPVDVVYETVDWYSVPLSGEDLIAGTSLILFSLFFIAFYAIVAKIMYENDKDVVGFRFLFSSSVADILILFNYGIWPGLTILSKSEIILPWMRHWVQMYLDWVWFSMCYHYMIISWSRFVAISAPHKFRVQTRTLSYSLCAACYIAAAAQVLCTHFQPWYVTFHYEPSAYGMLSEDFDKYLTEGQSLMFFTFHLLMIVIPIFFYSWSIVLLLKHRQQSRLRSRSHSAIQSTVESRLIVPCIFNTAVFIVGQVLITIGTGEGKWATWTVMLVFSANSAVNPLLLVCFSATIRRKLWRRLGLSTNVNNSKYISVVANRSSVSPSPPAVEGSVLCVTAVNEVSGTSL